MKCTECGKEFVSDEPWSECPACVEKLKRELHDSCEDDWDDEDYDDDEEEDEEDDEP